jgi:hypothetical protein
MTLATLALLPLVLAAEPAPPAPDPLAEHIGRDFDAPPPGASRKDQALWRAAYDANNAIVVERAAATRLHATLAAGRYEDRLEELSRRDADGARRAGPLLKELTDSWTESADLLTRQWPVDPTRACRYPLLHLESALTAKDVPARALHALHEELEECVEKAQLPLRALTRSNGRLRTLVARLDRELPPQAPVVPVAAAGAAEPQKLTAADPQPAAAPGAPAPSGAGR